MSTAVHQRSIRPRICCSPVMSVPPRGWFSPTTRPLDAAVAQWYRGKDEIRAFLLRGPLQSRWRFQLTTANGQLAFGTYLWDHAAGAYVPGGLDVLTLLDGHVAEIAAFLTADLTRFGLPARIRP